jgi:hypothetical protein
MYVFKQNINLMDTRLLRFLFMWILAFLTFLPGAIAQGTLIYCGALLDGVKNNLQPEMTITVAGNKIISIQKGYLTPGANETVVDLCLCMVKMRWNSNT